MNEVLKYIDSVDKCYGLTGMVIGLYIYDGEAYLTRISLDDENSMEFSPEFFFTGNPRLSAKSVWNHLLKQYEISGAMTISNVLCRCLVHHKRTVDPATREALHEVISNEGHDVCSLDDDEIDTIFNKSFNTLMRVFSHGGVQAVAHNFAGRLKENRSLERTEVTDILRMLQNL